MPTSHKGNFFLKKMEARKIHSWSKCRETAVWCAIPGGLSIAQLLHIRFGEHLERGARKIVRVQDWHSPFWTEQTGNSASMNSQQYIAYIKPARATAAQLGSVQEAPL